MDNDDPLAQLLAEQNMSLDGLRQFLDAAWSVIVAYDMEPNPDRTMQAAKTLSDVAEAVTGKAQGAQHESH